MNTSHNLGGCYVTGEGIALFKPTPITPLRIGPILIGSSRSSIPLVGKLLSANANARHKGTDAIGLADPEWGIVQRGVTI
jgi:hypothetical protein